MLSFFRGTAGKSPDLSSQKRETLRGADSAYYHVGQTGKEGTENQGIEPQGVLSRLNVLTRLYFLKFHMFLIGLSRQFFAETRAFPLFSLFNVIV
jgi:hypothetical protein